MDFENWTNPELIFKADDLDQNRPEGIAAAHQGPPRLFPECRSTSYNDAEPDLQRRRLLHMSPFRYESVYLGMPAMYHSTGKLPVRVNTDGFHLVRTGLQPRPEKLDAVRVTARPFIPLSPMGGGAYDRSR